MPRAALYQIILIDIGLWTASWAYYAFPPVVLRRFGEAEALYLAVCSLTGAILCAVLFAASRVLRKGSLVPRSAALLVLLALALFVHGQTDRFAFLSLVEQPHDNFEGARLSVSQFLVFGGMVALLPNYLLFGAASGLTLLMFAIQAREKSLADARAAAQAAQLAALRFQVNPHFLFNALNAVTSLIGSGRNEEAGRVVSGLADFFRATLDSRVSNDVPLEEELEVAASYLAIESARFGSRLCAEISCPPELAAASLPHFILQPLVENAVKHGVARSRDPVTVRVTASARSGVLSLCVANDGADAGGEPPPGIGIGLRNVRERLEAVYGAAAALTTSRREGWFTARIDLPLSMAAEEVRT